MLKRALDRELPNREQRQVAFVAVGRLVGHAANVCDRVIASYNSTLDDAAVRRWAIFNRERRTN